MQGREKERRGIVKRKGKAMGRVTVVIPVLVAGSLLFGGGRAAAEAMAIKAVMAPKAQIHYEFPTPDRHFILMVRREGNIAGSAPFDGAHGTEYGVHDLIPGVGGNPRGYFILVLKNNERVIMEWSVQATFIPGPDGKPKLLDNGVWKFVGGTGEYARIQGAGTMNIKPVSPTDREFSFRGEYVLRK